MKERKKEREKRGKEKEIDNDGIKRQRKTKRDGRIEGASDK